MADQPKKKPLSAKNFNDTRPNRKANKSQPDTMGRKAYRGSHTTRTSLTTLEKTLLGGGLMVGVAKRYDPDKRGKRWNREPQRV